MTDSEYVRLNTSLATASNSKNLHVDKRGQIEACIELRLPNEVITPSNGRLPKEVKLQTTKMRLSMINTPVVDVPVFQTYTHTDGTIRARTSCALSVWPFYQTDDVRILPAQAGNTWGAGFPYFEYLEFNLTKMQEDPKTVDTEKVLHLRNIRWFEEALQNAFDSCFNSRRSASFKYCQMKSRFFFDGDSFSITTNSACQAGMGRTALFGVPGSVRNASTQDTGSEPSKFTNLQLDVNGNFVRDISTSANSVYTSKYNIIINPTLRNLLYFLPCLPSFPASALNTYQTPHWRSDTSLAWTDDVYILDTVPTVYTESEPYMLQKVTNGANAYSIGVDQTLTWKNVPSVLLSPISSIVLLLDGVNVNGQVQPINIQQAQGSSLTTTIPVIENYSSLAANLRDLKDELVISRDAFTNNVLCSIVPSPGMMRDIRLRACYITKKGNLVPIYIPPEGEFSLQLSFLVKY